MTLKEELETLANDCEEYADEADDKHAWQSVASRIRRAVKRIAAELTEQ